MVRPAWFVDALRCPATGLRYRAMPSGLVREDGHVLANAHGIASFVDTDSLTGTDLAMQRRYAWLAPWYDWSERVLGRMLTGVDMQSGRAAIVHQCGFTRGVRLLEVSPGPGVYLPHLRAALGDDAQIAAVDLSLPMLRQFQLRPDAAGVELVQADAQALPFADASFDALFHFGGVNLFNDPQLALREFVRVVRPGGRIAWGDERMSERFRHPVGRWVLPRLNPGFGRLPPPVPAGLDAVRRLEVFEGLGYLVVANRALPANDGAL